MFFTCSSVFILLLLLQAEATDPGGSCKSNSSDVSGSALIGYLTDPCRYDKWTRPSNNSEPTNVTVRILVYFLGSIEAQNLQFTVQILLSYRWVDPRLNHSGEIIEGEGSLRDKIWTPHLYLVNEHDSKVMGSGQADVLVSIDNDGTVSYTTRLKATLLCRMNLKKFPFDNQICPLVLESWSYNTSQLILGWEKDTPINFKTERQLTEYTLVRYWTNSSVTDYSIGGDNGDHRTHQHFQSKFAGNYSSVTVEFLLEREVGHYIMDYYVPSIFLVVVSWVSFWLDPNAVPGRTTLGTSTMLTFITLSRNIGSSLPKVSYVKATEIWFIICTAFIFASLVEFAFVNTIWRRRKNVELKKVSSKYILKSTLTPQQKRRELSAIDRSQSFSSLDESKLSSSGLSKKYNSQLTVTSVDSISKNPFAFNSLSDESLNINVPVPEATPANKGWFTMTPQEVAQWIDKRSRIVFPVAFIIFNLLYWVFVWF